MTIKQARLLLPILLTLFLTETAVAATLWSIGQADQSYAEFALAGKYQEFAARFPNDPVFVVGQSDPAKDWPYIHPGPSDAWAGARKHVFSIQFDLDKTPNTAYRLKVLAADAQSGRPVRLQANVNDAFERTMTFEPGRDERSLSDPRVGRRQTQAFLFSASCLHKGRNTIALTVVEGSWLLYDAVILETTGVKGVEIGSVAAASTPLFAGAGSDLKQAVRVTIQNDGLDGKAVVSTVSVPGTSQDADLKQGANTVYLLVPPYTQTTPQEVEVRAGDKTYRAAFEGKPERRWKIYVAPSAHTDIGYTDLQEKVFAKHNDNTAAVLKACESHPDFKWNLEVFAQADWYRQRGDDAFKELERRITERRIGLTGLYLNMLTGLCTGEEMARVLAPAQEFGRAHNVPVTVGTITDVPTTVGTMPMFLKQAGIQYFVDGINDDRGPVWLHADKRMVQSPFWWEGLDGSRVLAVFTRSYGQAQVIGLRDSVDVLQEKLPGWLKAIDRPDYSCDAIYGNGAFWDNESVTPRYIEVAEEWNKKWAYPQIIVARVDEFFEYVSQNFAEALPTFRGDMGSYWEDGAASSATETGMNRVTKARLNAAERWFALAAAQDAKFAFPRADFDKAWQDAIYYDEHTWGAAGSIGDPNGEQTLKQWEYKASYARRAAEKAHELLTKSFGDAFGRMASAGAGKSDGAQYITVQNPDSWPHDVLVAVPGIDKITSVVNSVDGKAAVLLPLGEDAFFEARQVPALGYRCYKLETGKAAPEAAPLLHRGADQFTWESPSFRYRIDPKTGAFTSIEDLRTHREWVDVSSGYGVNQFLYVIGGNNTSLIHPGATPAPPLQPVTHSQAQVEERGNAGELALLYITRQGPELPKIALGNSPQQSPSMPRIVTWCVVHADGRLDIINRVIKEATTEKEAGYFAFPFKLGAPDNARTFFDLPYGIVEADKEQPPGACREWYAANTFAAVTDNAVAAYVTTREVPLFTVGNLNRGAWPAKLDNNNGTVFAYVFNNYWHTNYKASQGGNIDAQFSVKLSEKGFDPVLATRFGIEGQPLTIGEENTTTFEKVSPGPAARRPEESFIKMPDGPVVLTELTQGDNSRLLARLYNPSFEPASTSLEFTTLDAKNAWRTDLFGQHEQPISMSGRVIPVSVPARSIVTLAIETARRAQ